MNGFRLYQKMVGIRLHFTSKTYEYRGEGLHNLKPETYTTRRDRHVFDGVARKLMKSNVRNVDDFLVATIMANIGKSSFWIHDYLDDQAYKACYEFTRYRESFEYLFQQDCKYYVAQFGQLKLVKSSEPQFLKLLYNRDKGHYQSLIMMREARLSDHDMWVDFDKIMSDTIYWPKWRLRMMKCTKFLQCDPQIAKTIFNRVVNEFYE